MDGRNDYDMRSDHIEGAAEGVESHSQLLLLDMDHVS
jgi:hypothetical protein